MQPTAQRRRNSLQAAQGEEPEDRTSLMLRERKPDTGEQVPSSGPPTEERNERVGARVCTICEFNGGRESVDMCVSMVANLHKPEGVAL
ncbi:hypothetical protein L7F22_044757, partial [Adiantum nelumboides]|nr:hypothetical protein [Adiantum nelumboides]